jgi:hypothetical protein
MQPVQVRWEIAAKCVWRILILHVNRGVSTIRKSNRSLQLLSSLFEGKSRAAPFRFAGDGDICQSLPTGLRF